MSNRKSLALTVAAVVAVSAALVAIPQLAPQPPSKIIIRQNQGQVIYLPMVFGGKCADPSKGIAGINFAGTITVQRAYQSMCIGVGYNWNMVVTQTRQGAYPLPFQPFNSVRSSAMRVWNVLYSEFACDTSTDAGSMACAVAAVKGAGPAWVVVFNEPDNDNPQFGDAITPALMAQDWHTIRYTLLGANPQLKFIVGNWLWPRPDYAQQFVSEYQRLYGEYPLSAGDLWGFHLYPEFGALLAYGNPCYADRWTDACMRTNSATTINDITRTMAALNPVRGWALTEFGTDPSGSQPVADIARWVPIVCAAARSGNPQFMLMFEGVYEAGASYANASVLKQDGTLSEVGQAYANC